MNRQKYALITFGTFALSVMLFAYGLLTLGVFSKDKIVVTSLATTGPDYEVVLGRLKLQMQLPDSVDNSDVSGIMTTGQGFNELGSYLANNYLAFGDYFVLTGKVVGVKKSDGDYFHPLIEISSWRHIDILTFWSLVGIDIGLLILSAVFYKKFKTKKVAYSLLT